MSTKEFFKAGGFASYVQMLCAVAALIFGICIYSSWRDQELATRRADVAADILKGAFELTSCIHSARGRFLVNKADKIELSNPIIAKMIKEVPKQIATCDSLSASLKVKAYVGSKLLPESVTEQLSLLLKSVQEVKGAGDYLNVLNRSILSHSGSEEEYNKRLRNQFEKAGLMYIDIGKDIVVIGRGEDDVGRTLWKARSSLEEELAPIIRLD